MACTTSFDFSGQRQLTDRAIQAIRQTQEKKERRETEEIKLMKIQGRILGLQGRASKWSMFWLQKYATTNKAAHIFRQNGSKNRACFLHRKMSDAKSKQGVIFFFISNSDFQMHSLNARSPAVDAAWAC